MNRDINEKNYTAAAERVQKEIDKFPKQGEPWLLMAQIHKAQAAAIVLAEKQKNPTAGARLSLGEVPAAQPEVGKAEAALLKAIELNPNLRNGYMMLADLYVAVGKQQQALDRLNSLLAKTNDVA